MAGLELYRKQSGEVSLNHQRQKSIRLDGGSIPPLPRSLHLSRGSPARRSCKSQGRRYTSLKRAINSDDAEANRRSKQPPLSGWKGRCKQRGRK